MVSHEILYFLNAQFLKADLILYPFPGNLTTHNTITDSRKWFFSQNYKNNIPSLSGKGFFSWTSTFFMLVLSNFSTSFNVLPMAISVFITEKKKIEYVHIIMKYFLKFHLLFHQILW